MTEATGKLERRGSSNDWKAGTPEKLEAMESWNDLKAGAA